jgi:integrase
VFAIADAASIDTGKRVMPGSDKLLTLFREQCLRVGAARPNALIFPNEQGQRRQPNSVTQLFRRVCDRLGFEGYTLHTTRHYRVTRWRTDGVDLEVVSAMAGHQSIKVTGEVYSEATMERKRAALKKRKTT